jgi:hypothetical protein
MEGLVRFVKGRAREMTKRSGRVPAKRAKTPAKAPRKAAAKPRRAPQSGKRAVAKKAAPPSRWERFRDKVVANAFVAAVMGIVVLGVGARLVEQVVRPRQPASVTETLMKRIEESELGQIQDPPSGLKMSDDVRRAIAGAARDVGVDARYLVAVAARESGFDPAARAVGSSAEGLFQFTQPTWLRVVKVFGAKHGLAGEADAIVVDHDGGVSMPDAAARERLMERRDDALLSAEMAAELGLDNRTRLERILGRSATPSETYIAHFLGVSQAAQIIAAARATPTLSGSRLLPAAAASNPGVFAVGGDAASVSAIVARIDAYFAQQLPNP